jgi:microcystin-dependent protein
MALGDYSPTTYVNNTTPAINATNLNHAETKIDELDAWAANAQPVGSMTMYAGASAPTGWLLCDGSAVSRTTYSGLYTAISTTWGIGNGSTTFNLPDMREASPYGVGTWASVTGTTHGAITAHDARALAAFADDQGQGHRHNAGGRTDRSIGGSGANAPAMQDSQTTTTMSGIVYDPITDGTNGTPRTGTVTRGKTIGINFIIKY